LIPKDRFKDDPFGRMKMRERVELGLIPAAVIAIGLSAPLLPVQLATGELLAVACLAWLVQGGLRDLWLIYLTKARPEAAPRRKLACMCLESSAGLTGLLVGLGLTLCGIGGHVMLDPWRWMLLAAGVLTLGFLARDLVISWRPLGLRRVPDHHTILFTWW
jgi:MFS family permease